MESQVLVVDFIDEAVDIS